MKSKSKTIPVSNENNDEQSNGTIIIDNLENSSNEVEHDIQKNVRLPFGDRNLRLLSVITVMGAIIYVLNIFFKVFENTFRALYIGNNIPFRAEHLICSGIISILILLLIFALIYSFSEFLCFCNFTNPKVLLELEQKANEDYKQVLVVLKICPMLLLVSVILAIPFSTSNKYIAGIIDIIIIILTIILILGTRKELMKFVNNFMSLSKFIKLVIYWIVVNFLILVFGLFLCLSNENTIILFNDDIDYTLQITQKIDSPTDMDIIIQNGKKTKEIKVGAQEFTKAFVEVTQERNSKKNNDGIFAEPKETLAFYDKCYYEYCYRISLKQYLTDGINTIMIKFNKESYSSSINYYKIVNQVTLNNNKAIYTKKEFNINLR